MVTTVRAMFGSEQICLYVAHRVGGYERIRVSTVFSRIGFRVRG